MNMEFAACEKNFAHAKQLVSTAMKDNPDVAFLFITSDGDSPRGAYDRFVEENKLNEYGNHYLSNDEYLLLRELFRFNGIPRYLLVDRHGNVIDDNYQPYQFKEDFRKEREKR